MATTAKPDDKVITPDEQHEEFNQLKLVMQQLFESNSGDVEIRIADTDSLIGYKSMKLLSSIFVSQCTTIKAMLQNGMKETAERIIDMTHYSHDNIMIFLRYIYYKEPIKYNCTPDIIFELLDIVTYYGCDEKLIKSITEKIIGIITIFNSIEVFNICDKYPMTTETIRERCIATLLECILTINRCCDQLDDHSARFCCTHAYKQYNKNVMSHINGVDMRPCIYYTMEKKQPAANTDISTRYCCEHNKARKAEHIYITKNVIPDNIKIVIFDKLLHPIIEKD
ncbi:MAG: hypothetical protein Faunusvirus1_17 [Faunusvirus sp.]|jgi:hypothetical protein|uniref:BTB domain-containing protein n=1 Tax=Faunusvirus sp. TaxID=2487766 RepID=A0A3G4ZVS9_9VIRU|nr:MAG: hypothetical protein Faunusvirus1_17 [Faunusvirus sp.]